MVRPYDSPKSQLGKSDGLGFWRRQLDGFKNLDRYFHNGWVWLTAIVVYVALAYVILPFVGLHNVIPTLTPWNH